MYGDLWILSLGKVHGDMVSKHQKTHFWLSYNLKGGLFSSSKYRVDMSCTKSGISVWVGAKGKKSTSEKKQERKAAKTLSAILLAFIITWTPYSVLTVVNAILGKELAEQLIPQVK